MNMLSPKLCCLLSLYNCKLLEKCEYLDIHKPIGVKIPQDRPALY